MLPITLAAADPVAHVVDSPLIKGQFMGQEVWFVSNVTVMLVLSAIVTMIILLPAAKRITSGPSKNIDDLRAKGKLANFVEAICLYLREQVFRPVLADQTDKYAPMLWTFFWFILVCNLLGLVPLRDLTGLLGLNHGHGIGGTATQSIWVTAALAVTAFLFWNAIGFIKDPIGYLKHLTAGAPWFMWIVMIPVELLGMVVKPVALSLRLFANMTGGHIIIAVLLSFVPALIQGLGPAGYGLALLPLLGGVAINVLEILVAFIQAFIFTFLTTLFLGQLVVHEHEEHEEHGEHGHDDHGHDHAHGHKHAHAH
jgi:F-type H+-transporting ATPase subunit a